MLLLCEQSCVLRTRRGETLIGLTQSASLGWFGGPKALQDPLFSGSGRAAALPEPEKEGYLGRHPEGTRPPQTPPLCKSCLTSTMEQPPQQQHQAQAAGNTRDEIVDRCLRVAYAGELLLAAIADYELL